MVWPRAKEGSRGCYQEDVKHASTGKDNKERTKKIWLENIREDMNRWQKIAKCVEHEDKGLSIATWRRPIGENV